MCLARHTPNDIFQCMGLNKPAVTCGKISPVAVSVALAVAIAAAVAVATQRTGKAGSSPELPHESLEAGDRGGDEAVGEGGFKPRGGDGDGEGGITVSGGAAIKVREVS